MYKFTCCLGVPPAVIKQRIAHSLLAREARAGTRHGGRTDAEAVKENCPGACSQGLLSLLSVSTQATSPGWHCHSRLGPRISAVNPESAPLLACPQASPVGVFSQLRPPLPRYSGQVDVELACTHGRGRIDLAGRDASQMKGFRSGARLVLLQMATGGQKVGTGKEVLFPGKVARNLVLI